MARVDLYDTTLRDGSQGEGVNFSVQDKLAILRRLDDLGIDFIEGGYPLSNPKDAEFFKALRSVPLKNAKVAAFGMTRKKSISAADDTGLKALLAAKTALHCLDKCFIIGDRCLQLCVPIDQALAPVNVTIFKEVEESPAHGGGAS